MNQKQQKIAENITDNHHGDSDESDTPDKDKSDNRVTTEEAKELGGSTTPANIRDLTVKQRAILQEFKTGDRDKGEELLKSYRGYKKTKVWLRTVADKYLDKRELTKSQLETPTDNKPAEKPADEKQDAPTPGYDATADETDMLEQTKSKLAASEFKHTDKLIDTVKKIDDKNKRQLLLEEIEAVFSIANDDKADIATQNAAWDRLDKLLEELTASSDPNAIEIKKGALARDVKEAAEKMRKRKEMETVSPDEAKAIADKEKKDKAPNTIKSQPYKVTVSQNAKTTFSYDINDIYSIIEKDLGISLSERAKLEIDALIKRVVKNIHSSNAHGSEKVNKTIEKIEDYINSKSDGDTTFSFSGSDRDQLVMILQREIAPADKPKKIKHPDTMRKHGFDIMDRINALRNFV